MTENLSNVIFYAPPDHGIQKGRAFGTEGEWWAAEYLNTTMINLGLYNVTLENIADPYNRKLETLDQGLKINGTETIIDFYISPLWNESFKDDIPFLFQPPSYDENKLTYNFSHTNLKVYRAPNPDWWYNILNNITLIKLILDNESITNLSTLLNFLLPIFEEEYGFKFGELNQTNAPDKIPWWNDTYKPICNNSFVFINKSPDFNPNTPIPLWKNITPPWSNIDGLISYGKKILQKYFWKLANCQGLIEYDFNNHSYNMFHDKLHPLPTININGTVGKPIYQDPANHTIDFWINQSWNKNVTSYNVIGQINGTDSSKTVIVSSLYDSWWNQGTADSAIGVGIVLALAKYMKQLNETYDFTPKYNIKFILFGGEEYGYLGAKSYEKIHKDEKITNVIDINQVGFTQTKPRLTMNIITNRIYLKHLTKEIGDRTDYVERTNDVTDFETWCVLGGAPSNDAAFNNNYQRLLKRCRTICFLKDNGWNKQWRWTLHHRDGENHTQGDVIDYYNWTDVNITAEMIWNVTKFFSYTPDVWFEGEPAFIKFDKNNDGYDDTINVSYTIKTTWPSEHVSVRMVLHPKFKWKNPCHSILYRLREEKEYIIDQTGTSDYINISLPKCYPKGEYVAELYICNSREDAILDTIHLYGLETGIHGLEMLQHFRDVYGIDILERLSPLKGEIYKKLGIDIIDWIKRLPDFRNNRIRDIFIDILGYYIINNDSCNLVDFEMHPPNLPPETPDQPTYEGKGPLGLCYWYKTKTTDPEDDKIRFQWKWNGIKGFWSIWKYDSGVYHYKPHIWCPDTPETVQVRAKNPRSVNVWSPWTVETSGNGNGNGGGGSNCFFYVITSQTNQNNINNLYVLNSFNSNVVVAGESATYKGFSYGFSEPPNYKYDFDGSVERSEQIYQHIFDDPGVKYVNFTAELGETEAYYNLTINVVKISACFSMSQLGAQPNQTIYFNDTTISKYTINNWTWDFGDGNYSYGQNVSHNYSQVGVYNVTLNVTDSNNEKSSFWQIFHVETNPPEIITITYYPVPGTLGCNVTLFGDFFDNNDSGINTARVNISYPDGATNNITLYENGNSSYIYEHGFNDTEYVFNDTMQVGWYYYTIWVNDHANNTNSSAGIGFQILPAFGNSLVGNLSKNIMDNISGSNFTMLVNGTAESISACIQANLTTPPKTKCMIYRVNDSELIGTTEEKTLNTGVEPDWVTYNFTTPKPNLTADTQYVLVCWSDDTCNLSYYNTSDNSLGRYKDITYGNPPSPNISWDDNDSRLYSIYCTYSTIPEIRSVSASLDLIGFGYNTTITVEVEHYYTPIDNITVNITYPDNTSVNCSMTKVDDDIYQYVFDDSWSVGQYDYSIWIVDKLGASCSSSGHSFNVSAQVNISICTIYDEYEGNEIVNLTDPPGNPPLIGYELLDDGQVLHIWNKFDSYYFDTDNGVQLTNHYDEYWSHNVLMLGYYNNDKWNLIYRSDNLSGFNRDIESDNATFVNATLWKDLTYSGYDFRLAIRYHLGVYDNELTVIPYIKNIDDEDIPYVLGFAWEINDIKVDMTTVGDYIEINGTKYGLNESLDLTFSNMTVPVYCWDNTTNETFVCDYVPIPFFYIKEDISDSRSESLYLRWNESLKYKVKVKSRDGQLNAPVTLAIRIGTLESGQEKHTKIYWHDASEVVYYFDSYDNIIAWSTSPGNMVDGSNSTYASTQSEHDIELCKSNTCQGSDLGTISKVEIRCYGYYSGSLHDIILRAAWPSLIHVFTPGTSGAWSSWFDITDDPNAPDPWTWNDIFYLDCEVESGTGMPSFTLYCSKVEVRVTYTPYNQDPTISSPVPANGASGVSIQPMLNISVSDPDGDNMNITWLSNKTGSWLAFGTNNSVGNGTYHQNFSNATMNGWWWYWKVNVSDGVNFNESSVYKFYTGYESKITNTGSTDIKGYLLMQVHYYDTSNSTWVVVDDTINETCPRTIPWDNPAGGIGQHILALDTIFNAHSVNTSSFQFGNGTYRVYAAFCNPDGDVLKVDSSGGSSAMKSIDSWYEFKVTFD